MSTCPRCGATVEPRAPSCSYCGTATAYAKTLEEQRLAEGRAAREAEEQQRRAAQSAAGALLRSKSTFALLTAIAGTVLCCLPLNLVAIVLSLRAKGLAKKYELIAPSSATVALILGLFGFVLSLIVWVSAGLKMHRDSQREDELARLIARKGGEPVLGHELACALVEHRLLSEGFGGDGSVSDLECSGRLTRAGSVFVLDAVRVKPSSGAVTVVACFTRGERWRLIELRADGSCHGSPLGDAGVDTGAGNP